MAMHRVPDFISRFWLDLFPGGFDSQSQLDLQILEDFRAGSPAQLNTCVLPTELEMADAILINPRIEGGKGFFSLVFRDEWQKPRRRMSGQRTSVKPNHKLTQHENRTDTSQLITIEQAKIVYARSVDSCNQLKPRDPMKHRAVRVMLDEVAIVCSRDLSNHHIQCIQANGSIRMTSFHEAKYK
jgi:hypothetical protein